jgi:argininosuccinate lyase
MPQKRNPDALELVRATGAKLRARIGEVISISGPLSSGYHRDLQLTKEPFLEGLQASIDVLVVMHTVLDTLGVDRARCRAALQPAIGATDAMCQRVASGEPLRTAYQEVAQDPVGALFGEPGDAWRLRTHIGAPGNVDLKPIREASDAFRRWVDSREILVEEAWHDAMT